MRYLIFLLFLTGCGLTQPQGIHYDIPTNPDTIKTHQVLKQGFESTPFVWNGKLKYIYSNRFGVVTPSIQIIDFETKSIDAEIKGYILPSAEVINGVLTIYATDKWDKVGGTIYKFTTNDLITFTKSIVLQADSHTKVFNTSPAGNILAYETSDGTYMGTKFIGSSAFIHDAYCPTLKFINGYYYLWFGTPYAANYYVTKIARSSDLINWTVSDKVFLAPDESELTNNSDMDLTEFNGQVYIFYNAGNQNDQFWITYATYSGTLQNLVGYYF